MGASAHERFVATIEGRLERDFSTPNRNPEYMRDMAALARYLYKQGLANRVVSEIIDVSHDTVKKWTSGTTRAE